jgi:transcriptional regulator with XRE-family HTH domain
VIHLVGDRHTIAVLRDLRRSRGLTQRELGRRVHVTAKAITYRESGRRRLFSDVLFETAAVLGFDIALIPKRHPDARPTGTGWPT